MISLAQMHHQLGADLRPAIGKTVGRVLISGVHISELADPTPYLEGGELLLTTGIPVSGTPATVEAYVRRLADRGVAALGLGLGAGVDRVPAELPELCARSGVELLVVPHGTPFMQVSRTYWDLVAKAGQADLAASLGTQTALARAATRPDALAQVVKALAQALGGWVAYLPADNGPETLWPAGNQAILPQLRQETARLDMAGTHAAATFQIHGAAVVEYPVLVGRQIEGFLAIGTGRKLTRSDRQVIMTVCVLLSLKATQQKEIDATAAALGSAVAKLLLTGYVEAAQALAADLGIAVPPGHVRLLVVRDESDPAAARAQLLRRGGPALRALTHALTHCRLRHRAGDVSYYILDAVLPDAPAAPLAGSEFESLGLEVPGALPQDPPPAASAFAAAVVSDPLPLPNLGEESGKLAAMVRSLTGGQVVDAGSGELDPRASGWVATLRAYPRADLAGSVRSYLRHRGSWEGAARELGIHRNSLRHRISIAARLLQADLDDPDVAANLWLALRWV